MNGAGIAGTRFVGASDLRGQGAFVRNNFGHYDCFRPGWYNRYPGAWFAAGWAAGSAWPIPHGAAGFPWYGYPADYTPMYYNYGDNVTYNDGNVYYDNQVYASQADYAQQATSIAAAGAAAMPPADDTWQALGVFAMVKGDEQTSDNIFQLALNKQGVLRGNYYNAVSNKVTPVHGSLDKDTQRVC